MNLQCVICLDDSNITQKSCGHLVCIVCVIILPCPRCRTDLTTWLRSTDADRSCLSDIYLRLRVVVDCNMYTLEDAKRHKRNIRILSVARGLRKNKIRGCVLSPNRDLKIQNDVYEEALIYVESSEIKIYNIIRHIKVPTSYQDVHD
jgi:hypothetical protein